MPAVLKRVAHLEAKARGFSLGTTDALLFSWPAGRGHQLSTWFLSEVWEGRERNLQMPQKKERLAWEIFAQKRLFDGSWCPAVAKKCEGESAA